MTEPSSELQDPPGEPQVIVVGVDASAGAALVTAMAARMSRGMPSATVNVVHVFRTSRLDRARAGTPTGNADMIEDAKEQLQFHIRSIRKQTRAQVTAHFAMGDPATEILRVVHDLNADVLIVGTHDYVGFERFLLGSVAETLMRKSGCPVMIVRPKSHKHS